MLTRLVRGSLHRSTTHYIRKYKCSICQKQHNSETSKVFLSRRNFSRETLNSAQLETLNEHGITFEDEAEKASVSHSHTLHTPVLLREVIDVIQPKDNQVDIAYILHHTIK